MCYRGGGGNYKLHPTAVNWYNGTIRTDARYAWQLSGVVNVLDGAAGKLIKVRTNDLTLDCSYSAGDIEVSAGRLIFSRKTTMPAGQKILVRDGATLVLNYAPGAKIVVSNRTSNPTANEIVLAEASGGIVGIPAVVGLRRDVKVRNGQLILIKPSLMVIFR